MSPIEAFPIPMNEQNINDSVSFDGVFAPGYAAGYSPEVSQSTVSHNSVDGGGLNFPIFGQHVANAQPHRILLINVSYEGRNIPMNIEDYDSVGKFQYTMVIVNTCCGAHELICII